jgi:hypothetical protein
MATIIRLDDPKYAAQVAALSAEYDREYKLNSGRDPPRDNEETFDQLLAKAKALAQGDTVEGARLIEGAAWLTGVDALQKALFLDTVKGRLKSGVKIEALRDLWAIAAAKAAQDRGPTPEEAAWERKEQARITAEEKALEAAVLFKGAKSLAMVEDIVADAVSTAQLAGVVGEASAVSAHYLAMTSRVLHESRVLSTLGTGQSSLGKSYVAEKVEIMMPPECVIPITSGSPKSLVYMVVDDPAALKHRIVIVHEAAGFIAGNDVEANPSAAIVREIMTRGRANYPYVERNDDGQLTTKMLIAEGPIALVTTSARDNLDPEMLNRLVAIPGNESPKATRDIQIAQVTGAAEKTKAAARPRILAHRALQEWLQAEAPVRTAIPEDLRQAVFAALGKLPDTVKTRRDVPAFLLAVKASAALHKAQRQADNDGAVIATLADYRIAHRAFDCFLALDYSSKLKPEELIVLAAIEKLIAADQVAREAQEKKWTKAKQIFPFEHILATEPKAHISYDLIAAELNMKSRKTLAKRVKALKRAGAIALESRKFGQPVRWELLLSSAQESRAQHRFFMPAPEEIEVLLNDPVKRAAEIEKVVDAARKMSNWALGENQGRADEADEVDESEFL